jgi:hypothetical protein
MEQMDYRIDVREGDMVYVDGLCIGHGRIVEGRIILEVKDRHRFRVVDRGRQAVPVDLLELMTTLHRELARRNDEPNRDKQPGEAG